MSALTQHEYAKEIRRVTNIDTIQESNISVEERPPTGETVCVQVDGFEILHLPGSMPKCQIEKYLQINYPYLHAQQQFGDRLQLLQHMVGAPDRTYHIGIKIHAVREKIEKILMNEECTQQENLLRGLQQKWRIAARLAASLDPLSVQGWLHACAKKDGTERRA